MGLSAPPHMSPESRGIVICGGGVRFFTCAWINIQVLRKHGCILPIELWHLDNEINDELREELARLGVECRNLTSVTSLVKDPLSKSTNNYTMKPLSILHSKFTKVLFLDADNVCVADPTYLFEQEHFTKHGAAFWPDFWKTDRANPIWRLIDNRNYTVPEQDSGQLLVDKSMCWKELNLCCYFNQNCELYYRFLHYDKDTFKFAWLALKKPFSMAPFETAVCGYVGHAGNFIGTTMVQHDFDGNIIFLHRNILKWDVTRNFEFIWEQIRQFKTNSQIKEYYLGRQSSNGETSMNLCGDIEVIDFTVLFPKLEEMCLHFLRELRESPFYYRFLISYYIARFRGVTL